MNSLKLWLSQQLSVTTEHYLISGIEFVIYTLLIMGAYMMFKKYILEKVKVKINEKKWNFGNYLIKHKLFSRVAILIPLAAINVVASINSNHKIVELGETITMSLMYIFVTLFSFSFLNASIDIASNKGFKKLPLKPISQVLKIVLTLLCAILVYSKMINSSPSSIFAGLGALSAILMFVFKDTILSVVASIQITAHQLVEKGDWITVPNLGVDGDVEEVNLNIIRIKNFDMTETIIPTHSLMNNSFKNYRKMFERGRRIKRSITLDSNSVIHLDPDKIKLLKKVNILKDYIEEKQKSIINTETNYPSLFMNERYLTNIGTFRRYIVEYLKNHPEISNECTILVRQLENKGEGIPIELYCFTHNTGWIHNENVMADIFDHLYAVAKYFDLNIYQKPTGKDFQRL